MLAERPFNFAIVDEVDNIFIDEARTPLIISGPAEDAHRACTPAGRQNRPAPASPGERTRSHTPSTTNKPNEPSMGTGDFTLDEKTRQVSLTEQGHRSGRETAGGRRPMLLEGGSVDVRHHQRLAWSTTCQRRRFRAHTLFHERRYRLHRARDDAGRHHRRVHRAHDAEGRRFSEGLHQAH